MTLRATDYALLSQDAYQPPQLNKNVVLDGVTYRTIDFANNPLNGFQATAYERADTHDVVIAYRGSDFSRAPLQDGAVDVGMVLVGVNAQTPDALAFTEKVIAETKRNAEDKNQPVDITVTGHSLGGTLAEISAAKFGLHGETFNAYGAAGLLQGVPQGGDQVIDNIRAGDPISAASPQFGEVRIYAAPQDIERLSKAGYRNDSGLLSPRNVIEATDISAHGIDNFVPDSKTLGHSIMSPENEARYRANSGMIDRYRNDIGDARVVLSAGWEIPKAAIDGGTALAHTAEHVAEQGAHAVQHATHVIANEAVSIYDAGRKDLAQGVRTVEHAAQSVENEAEKAFSSLSHPGSWFGGKPAVTAPQRLDDPAHPDYALFQQTRGAVHRLDAQRQRIPDQHSENLTAALTAAARRDGLSQVDHVVLSDDASQIFAVQGDMNSPTKRIASIATAEAVHTPIDQSSAAWAQTASSKQPQPAQAPLLAQQAQQQQARHETGFSPAQ
jgi:hypothetical protein